MLGNHSCVPNAEITFPYNNNVMVLKAVQDIAEDEVSMGESKHRKIHVESLLLSK